MHKEYKKFSINAKECPYCGRKINSDGKCPHCG